VKECHSFLYSVKSKKKTLFAELKSGSNIGKLFFHIWFFLLRYVTPIAILIVFLDALGFLNFMK
jgi:neurotransmitter:Na+ symporter, NSS family